MNVHYYSGLLGAACFLTPSYGGLMADSIDLQTYRDFAENRGIFDVNARDVAIYDKNGDYVGTIPKMMNFDGVADAHHGEAALVGGPGFIATVAHDYDKQSITFTKCFGATQGTPFYDSYRCVLAKNAWGDTQNYAYDYRVQRLSKIVTEAEYAPYLTDPEYLDNMKGRLAVRVGAGTQAIATGEGRQEIVGRAYSYLTGGTVVFEGQASVPGTGEPDPENAKTYPAYRFWYNFSKPSESSPLPSGSQSGDSGSPCYVFNENSGKWEWVGATQSHGGGGYGTYSQMRSGNQWASDYVDSFNRTISVAASGDVLWNVTDADGNGTFVQGGISTDYIGLASGVRGDTSTQGKRATDAQIGACSNLIFDGSGGTIVLQGSVDTGAGSLTFNRDYVLSDGGNASYRLNTAGFVVAKNATVTTLLTGASGDEWRKIGEGTLVVSGHGNNAADINVGGGGLLILDRDGYAARNVKLNGGGAMVRLAGENQLSGEFIFGHRGGTVDLYGHNLSLSAITHLDYGACFGNFRSNTAVTFTFTGSGAQDYLGGFMDSGSMRNGQLHVVYAPGTGEGSVWNLSGAIINSGTWTLQGGEVKVAGVHTLHAGGYVDENDWQTAVFSTGVVNVNKGARFSTGGHAEVASSVIVANGGTYGILSGGSHRGDVTLSGSGSMMRAEVDSGTAVESGKISGSGSLIKSGDGALLLKNRNNDFSGTARVEGGLVHASSAGSLGKTVWTLDAGGAVAVDGSDFSSIAGKLDRASSGTFALLEDRALISGLNGFRNLSLGAVGEVNLGTHGTTELLSGWTEDGGWALGGGGGTLTVNLKLSGSGTLSIGNGSNTGTVVLANAHNSDSEGGAAFSGAIELNGGVRLAYTDIRSFGTETGNLLVKYGTSFILGTEADAALAHVSRASSGVLLLTGNHAGNLDLGSMGLNSVYIGADGQAVLSGSVTAGTQGYLFGGNGTLTVAASLAGNHSLTVDAQGMGSGGGVILAADNTYSGETRILSGASLTVGNGGTSGALGTGAVANDGTLAFNRTDRVTAENAISGTGALIQNGSGNLVLAGNNSYSGGTTIAAGTLTVGDGGTSGSLGTGAVVNNGVLVFNRSDAFAVNIDVSGRGALVKNGSGTLTIQKRLSYTGGTTVNEGTLVLGAGGANGIIRGPLAIREGAQVTLKGGDSFGYSGGNTSVWEVNITGGTLYFGDKVNQTFQNTVFNLTGATVDGVSGGRMDIWTNASFHVNASGKASEINNVNVQLRSASPTVFTVERGTAASDLNVSSNIVNSGNVKGSFRKAGAGIMVLSGKNTYSGGTYIDEGMLVAASSQALGTGRATVNSGGCLLLGGLDADAVPVSLGNNILVKDGGILSGSATLSGNTTMESGSIFELTFSMGGSAGNELACNSLMLQSGVFQIDAGAMLKLAGVSIDYSSDFWGTSRILNFIEGGADATLTGNFTLDTSAAGDYASYGQWSLQKSEDSKDMSMVWTPNVAPEASMTAALTATAPVPVPEPSSCMLLMAALGMVFLRRSAPRNE